MLAPGLMTKHHVISGASHLAARERPDAFNAIVDAFLERQVL